MTNTDHYNALLDPTVHRMTGITVHQGMRFDNPLITEIAPNLWVGGVEDGMILPRFFDHVVSLYQWEAYTVNHSLTSTLTVKMYDADVEPNAAEIDSIVAWVQAARRSGTVLLHCQAGLNRSMLVAASVLMDDRLSADEAITRLRAQRSPAVLCNATFEKWLRARDGSSGQ
ncbi:MAG: dual specificity protein phosphatase family protein [Candidatus Dormibacteraeota bacterium]|nr:dual specificity protein phosphatase family protein [Candidatus Dormibacteraeota bacterium]